MNNLKGELSVMDNLGIKPNYAALGRKYGMDWRTVKKYHNGYCRGMNNCTHAERWVTVSEAKTMGRSPCGYCY